MHFKPFILVLLTISITSWSINVNANFKKLKQEGALVYYTGKAVIAGEFWYPISEQNQEVIGNQLCFTPSKKHTQLIPRDKDDTRSAWFCFSDTKKAAQKLGLTQFANMKVCEIKGNVTIEITNYRVDKEVTDTNDTAELVKIIKQPESINVRLLNEDGSDCK